MKISKIVLGSMLALGLSTNVYAGNPLSAAELISAFTSDCPISDFDADGTPYSNNPKCQIMNGLAKGVLPSSVSTVNLKKYPVEGIRPKAPPPLLAVPLLLAMKLAIKRNIYQFISNYYSVNNNYDCSDSGTTLDKTVCATTSTLDLYDPLQTIQKGQIYVQPLTITTSTNNGRFWATNNTPQDSILCGIYSQAGNKIKIFGTSSYTEQIVVNSGAGAVDLTSANGLYGSGGVTKLSSGTIKVNLICLNQTSATNIIDITVAQS